MRSKTRDQRKLRQLAQSLGADAALQTQTRRACVDAVVETQTAIEACIRTQPTQAQIIDRQP